jgi:hypothetical protein
MGFGKSESSVNRFNEFRSAADKARAEEEAKWRQSEFFAQLSEEKRRAWLEENREGFRPGKYFCFNDPKLRGSVASASAAKGAGGTVELAINPFGLVGLNTEVSVSQSIKGAKQRSVVVHGGPPSIVVDGAARSIPQPIVLNSFIGAYVESKTQVGLEVSVGWSAKASTGVQRSDKGNTEGFGDAETEGKGGSTDKEEEEVEPSIKAELAIAKFEAKAGGKVEGSYTYEKFISEDPGPLMFSHDEIPKLHDSLDVVLKEGSIKTMIKAEACKHINDNSAKAYGNKKLTLHSEALWGLYSDTVGTGEVLKVLRSITTKDATVRAINKSLVDRLTAFETNARPGKHLLILSSHQAEGKACAFGSAEATLRAGGMGVGLEAAVELGVKGAGKWAFARYQSCVSTEPYARPGLKAGDAAVADVMTTYDSTIRYSTFSLGLEVSLEAEGFGVDLVPEAVKGGIDSLNEQTTVRFNRLNRMCYRTAIASWVRPAPGIAPLHANLVIPQFKGIKDFLKDGVKVKVDALAGTGVAFGESFVIENLRKLYERILVDPGMTTSRNRNQRQERRAALLESDAFKEGAENDSQLKLIAEQLCVTPEDLLTFLEDFEVRNFVLNSQLPDACAVLLESTFRTTVKELEVECYKDSTGEFHASLSKATGDLLFGAKEAKPQSMRLRYRKRDVQSNDKALFKLGFDKFLGNELKITLERVDRAGHDAILDVRTVFYDPALRQVHNSNGTEAYAAAVPPAALFAQ